MGDDDNIRTEIRSLISSLPSDADFQGAKIYNYQGCWYRNFALQAVIDFQRNCKPTDTDIILASYPKSGTTWAKALTVALLERSVDGSCNNHPLASGSPHMLVPSFELDLYRKSSEPDCLNRKWCTFKGRRSTTTKDVRNFALQAVIDFQRNFKPTDTDIILASYPKSGTTWAKALTVALLESSEPDLTKFPSSPRVFSTHMPLHTLRQPLMNAPCKIVYMCRNRSSLFWTFLLSYWRGSLEDLKAEPCAQVMRLAEFLGCPFSQEEKRGGSVEKILELCSFGNLSSFDVNQTGTHHIFFRKGEVDTWKNHLTTEMQKKIDMVIQEKFQGSGLEF
ncbi:hypothetical protein F2Q70_00043842 [Brassica cretica]|uniref:Sulfotransferase n=1 Tax=Brassica cretica TaxID=69181 RepID=A0A8S9LWB0_BRACR|nr:hypothetical protein F2Q70_00043842 [Brassica cretica]KAF2609403.1 hypothetical protein F2Q68_00044869 [Brassica cretica]